MAGFGCPMNDLAGPPIITDAGAIPAILAGIGFRAIGGPRLGLLGVADKTKLLGHHCRRAVAMM